jgi:tetratricopeptide (TPR) repeat protein
MSGASDLDSTVGEAPSDPLEAGLAVAFGPDSGPPLPAAGSVVRALGAAPVQLREPPTEPAGPVVWPRSDAVPAEAPPRLQLHGEIARGGMGAVLKGRDTDLGRDVAVKVLLEAHQGRTELVQRFVEEAQIAGQLQHPGVVPVYEMGQLPDRRPYFTMKLVKGQTLARLLAQRADPAQDRPRFLKVFEQVCQALAYAHARGVLHRDLKPANVMVGSFGEVQVMDWGLAKVLQAGGAVDERTPEPAVATVRAADPDDATQEGSMLGTPAYMAPEQARGERVDRRSDVFGLGAILCEVLTGQPPYVGRIEDVAVQAQLGHLGPARERLAACGADPELVALAGRCLDARPEGRPADAGEVAAAVAAHLAGVQERLRRAELERAAAQARAAAERAGRRRTRALAAALVALVVVAAGGGLLVQYQAAGRRADQARRDAEQRQQVESALDKAAALRQQAHWGEAAAVLEQARQALGEGGPDDLRQRLDVAGAELALVNRLDAIRQRRATWVERHFDDQTAAHDYAATFREAGLAEAGDDEDTVAARVRASGVAGPLVTALDDWASAVHWAAVVEKADAQSLAWLLGVARRADPDPWRDRFRDPAVWRDRQKLRALADDALRGGGDKLGELSPQLLAALGGLLGGAEAVPLLRAAQRRYPNDFWLSLDLGNALHKAKQKEEALGYWRVAVALRPDAAAAHNNLGNALADKKDLEGAIAAYRAAIALDPKLAYAHNNLGIALQDKQDLDGAVAEYRAAVALDPKFAYAHYNLGSALRKKGDLDGAVAEYRTAVALDPKFAYAHYSLGVALRAKGDVDGAIAAYRQAIALDPKDAAAHNNLGNALRDKGDLDGAVAALRQAIALDPKDANAHNNLGLALIAKKDVDGAIAEFKKAIELNPKDAPAHSNLGALFAKKDWEAAIAEYRTAIALDPDYPEAHCNLGLALREQGRFAEALDELRRGHALSSRRPGWTYPSADWVRQCEPLAELDRKLPTVLSGEAAPAGAADRLALGQFCRQHKRLYAAAARLYAGAFAADPRLTADLRQPHRYNAACSAARAAAGQGEDAKHLPDKVQQMLRRQALAWLRDDLALYRKQAEREEPAARQLVRERMRHWQQDTDLVTVRDEKALSRLPDDERAAWRQLWDDVEALLRQVGPAK